MKIKVEDLKVGDIIKVDFPAQKDGIPVRFEVPAKVEEVKTLFDINFTPFQATYVDMFVNEDFSNKGICHNYRRMLSTKETEFELIYRENPVRREIGDMTEFVRE